MKRPLLRSFFLLIKVNWIILSDSIVLVKKYCARFILRKTYLIAYLLCTTGAALYANSTNIQGSGIENIALSNEEFTQIELSDVLSANLTAIIIDPIAASENPDNGNAVQTV